MGPAIGQVLGLAVGVAISPVPIIALILMLFSRRATSNGLAFVGGWLVGLTVAALAVLALGIQDSGDDSDSGGWVKLTIGALFLALAAKQWRDRPARGEAPATPAWMASIDGFSAVRSFGVGVLLSGVNPKNLGLTIAAASAIGSFGLDGTEEWIVVAVYVALASSSLILPLAGFLLARDRLTPALDALKAWLLANNATVMAVLFAVLGAKVLGDGISILTA